VRQRAIRCRWPRTLGNEKRARIQIPEGVTNPSQEGIDRGFREAAKSGSRKGNDRPLDGPIIKALEAHVATLKEQLAAAEGKAREEADALLGHVATLKAELEHRAAEIDTLKAQLARAETRASEESAKTARAIAAFQSLAERLEAMAEARRPWWRRLRMTG
jgi:DNA repair exonuclease SbcCD ATPase subunit